MLPNYRLLLSFELRTISDSFVLQQICALKRSKAIGLDRIKNVLLELLPHLNYEIVKFVNWNQCNEFPNIWKCAKVTALFKGGNRTNPSNYRPISILPTLSKILARAVHYQFYQYLNQHNQLLNEKQFGFGFWSKHSTVTAISSFCWWNFIK